MLRMRYLSNIIILLPIFLYSVPDRSAKMCVPLIIFIKTRNVHDVSELDT